MLSNSAYSFDIAGLPNSCLSGFPFIAIFRMVTCQEKALENLKLGLFDVLPAGSLDSLTAEDFRLLLNGVS